MTSEQRWAIDAAMKIVQKAGEEETFELNGQYCSVWTYEDPWGGGLLIRYGGPIRAAAKYLTVYNDYGDGICLMSVSFNNNQAFLREYDETTAWTLYLGACLSDVEKR